MNSLNKILNTGKSLNTYSKITARRCLSNISEEYMRQGEIFAYEQKRQHEAVGRIEKIDVQYEGQPESCRFIMNKNISTPYDCANHLGEKIQNRSTVALINQKTLWHMHKPLPDSCVLELLHYHIPNPSSVNKVFWRTCSFLLGAVASDAFKSNVELHLHSFPSPNVKSGSFVYDIQLGLDNWEPTKSELKVLSLEFIKFCQKGQKIECLDVTKNIALEIFKNNPHKSQQIPDIAAHNGDKVTLFKVGPHIDISRGPMLPNTNQLGRATVTNVIKLDTDVQGAPLYRFQGVALPNCIHLNHFAYGLIEDRGRILNSGRLPGDHGTLNEENSFMAHINQ
ncbi:39S ribosomal protein L39, mitochondrial [Anthonomus grandis grandis]|uniref:39S ribosomal protein L39, mitochondrial n=1 Tax=Anthonomus grandis grandis TaxID=2921223 RepID=UPI002164F71F|nr:39S ribosomal protein L39, mitochondrial [Anthonomus grandis grandis]